MDTELTVATLVLALALLPVVALVRRPQLRPLGLAAVATWIAVCGTLIVTASLYREAVAPIPERAVRNRPIQVAEQGYVSSRECGACHPQQHATWRDSFHRSMTQIATPQAVVAPFDDVELRHDGHSLTLRREGDTFWAESADGARPVVMTTGSHHFQVYWQATDQGRKLELLPFCYQIAEQRWMPMDALVLAHPSVRQNSVWNRNCIACHATAGQPRLLGGGEIDTRVAELGIACEACHGPGEEHARLARNPGHRYALYLGDGPDASIVDPAALSHRRSAELCGQCHSVNRVRGREAMRQWKLDGYRYRPGEPLEETRSILHSDGPESGAGQSFWPDGMVRVNGREYNALLETPCFQRGELSCLSCHVMHQPVDDPRSRGQWADDQLAQGMRDNHACTQCHERLADASALVDHTLHPAASSGSRCYDCHMPYTAYGLHKATRSHQVTSPSVEETLRWGRPNACNLCHLDRTLDWTGEHLQAWYRQPRPELPRIEREVATGALWALRGDAGQRALTAWHMGRQESQQASGVDWLPPYLAVLLVDPYPAVRSIAYRSLRGLPGFEDLVYDFAAPRASRAQARRRVIEDWEARGERTPRGRQVLVDHQGRLDRAPFDALLARRDDRFIYLRE